MGASEQTAKNTGDLDGVIAELGQSVDLDPAEIAKLVADALVGTYRRQAVDDAAVVQARIDLDRGHWELSRVASDGTQVPIPLRGDLARQSAQAVRTAVAERLRDVARHSVIREAELHHGQLLDAIVESRQGRVWMLRLGEHFGLLPPEEQMSGEELRLHQHIKVIVINVRERGQDALFVVSRSHPQLLNLLLEQEVPEILSGQVVIKAIAREAGRRSKVAVTAPRGDVDPRGACIGAKGVRHRAVCAELGSEQVQIVNWSDDVAVYIGEALAPATVLGVDLDAETRTAHVSVASDQLSLAIGRGGENARLVARLTGWRIDIAAPETP